MTKYNLEDNDWQKIRTQLEKLLSERGAKAAFARDLGMPRGRVNELLNGNEPRYSLGKIIERWIDEH